MNKELIQIEFTKECKYSTNGLDVIPAVKGDVVEINKTFGQSHIKAKIAKPYKSKPQSTEANEETEEVTQEQKNTVS